jgi:hypothetical protein
MIKTYTDGLSAIGDFQNKILSLPKLTDYQYENFFKTYLTENNQYYYNLLSFSAYFLDELDPSSYYEIDVQKSIPWTSISYNEYRTINLWWLIAIVNKIYNPLKYPDAGTKLKIIYQQHIKTIIARIKQNL